MTVISVSTDGESRHGRYLTRVEQVPGIGSYDSAFGIPLSKCSHDKGVIKMPNSRGGAFGVVRVSKISSGFFGVVGVPVIRNSFFAREGSDYQRMVVSRQNTRGLVGA